MTDHPNSSPAEPAPPAQPSAPASTPTPARPLRKGIYVLPNSFTVAALFCGFYAIVMAMNGRFDHATTAIFAAMILDGLDGRVARMTKTQSAFGEQMDSLSDMVSFGVAPALVALEWAMQGLGRWGWIASFIYCACAALRLARFNVNTSVVDKRWFQGLPSPSAAALVAGFIWLMTDEGRNYDAYLSHNAIAWIMFGITLYAGITMVTNLPYYSFKDLRARRSVPFISVVLVVLVIAIINIDPPLVLFGLFVLYALSGFVVYARRRAKGEPVSVISVSTNEPDEIGLHR